MPHRAFGKMCGGGIKAEIDYGDSSSLRTELDEMFPWLRAEMRAVLPETAIPDLDDAGILADPTEVVQVAVEVWHLTSSCATTRTGRRWPWR
jgi:hypothetical protein